MSLQNIIDRKFHEQAKEKYNDEEKELKREAWLSELGLQEKDVMMDERGVEYVYLQSETDHSDEYDVWFKKVELPYNLQTYHVTF